MLRNLGRAIWRQTRDMTVINYPKVIVYELFTADGYVYVKHDKEKNEYIVDKKRLCPAPELYEERASFLAK
jgi:hypothetical protein